MKSADYINQRIECLQNSDLENEKFVAACEQAKQLWERRCREYIEKQGEKGSCVLGAGFTVWYLSPRAKKPKRKIILHSPPGLLRSLTWENSKDEIKQLFKENGIEVDYEWGVMN